MGSKKPGYYLTLRFIGRDSRRLTCTAGPFATVDAAFDATEQDRDYARDYCGCTLCRIDDQGVEILVQHDRQANDYGYWHERRDSEMHA
jgi:hypothetical protein